MATESAPLEVYTKVSSEKGLDSVTSLIVGKEASVIIDPPLLIPDSKAVVEFTKAKTSKPVVAVFATHHHPDHYFSANPILDEWPLAKFYAHSYVREAIDREYDDKVEFWPSIFGDVVPRNPKRPEVYNYSFFLLPGNEDRPVILLGPVQGDSVDHTFFWLPRERVVITGDAMYAHSYHAWVEEIETPAILHAWRLTLQLIEGLNPVKIITGHIQAGQEFDKEKDLAHMHKYLNLFEQKITNAKEELQIQDIYDTFKHAFPQCTKNHDFFLGHLSNQYGAGGKKWEENRHHRVAERTRETLEGFLLQSNPREV
ncbi:hypothetical protein ABEF93_000078 [Exophiala dermatitidis]